MALALAVPSALIAADACYVPQSTACYPSSHPAACYPLQSTIFGAGMKDDTFALLPAVQSPFADERKDSQSAKEQTLALACPVPH
jgi:hypothetical protein